MSVWLPLSYSLCLTQHAHLFASKNQSFAGGDTADTQGCESWNRTLQDLFTDTMPNKVASIANVVEFFIKYTRAEVQLFRSARAGMRVDHRLTPRRNNRTRRDSGSPTDTGRPPESSVDLLNTRRRRTGRPRGSRNVMYPSHSCPVVRRNETTLAATATGSSVTFCVDRVAQSERLEIR